MNTLFSKMKFRTHEFNKGFFEALPNRKNNEEKTYMWVVKY